MRDEWEPAEWGGMGRTPNNERNAQLVAEWTAAKQGTRWEIAVRYGFASTNSARVIVCRLRKFGRTSDPLRLDKTT